jgi:hypothetical protein
MSLSPKNWMRLERAARPEGAQAPRPGQWTTLLVRGLVARGPAPPRKAGGSPAYPVRMYATSAGLAALKVRP